MQIGLNPAQWLTSIGIVGVLIVAGSQQPEQLYQFSQPLPVQLPLLPVSGLRADSEKIGQPSNLSATSVYVLTQENGEILYEYNSNTDYAPASTTKLLTALVARQIYAPDDVIIIPSVPFEDASQPLSAGQLFTVKELLAALLISSNNTAAYALATAHPAGYDGFISEMNLTAKKLDLNNSNFTNPAGFDDPSHRSTARDLGQLFRAALQDQLLEELLATQSWQLRQPDGSAITTLHNTHHLLNQDSRARAGKTGTTDEAKQVLITLFETRSHPYIIVVLGSIDRYGETSRLADWVDERYTWQIILPGSVAQMRELTE